VNINQLRTLIALAECKSFSLAADKLFLTQPAVSFQINSLEEHFGARLVDRSGKKAELTEEGRIVQEFARETLAGLARAEYQISELTRRVRGRLLVGASTIPGEYILPHLIGAFKDKYPEVQISLEIGDSDQIRKKVLEQRLDLGVVGAECKQPQLLTQKVLEDELILIVPQRHRWPSGTPVTVHDLIEENFILREKGSGTRQVLLDRLKEQGLDISSLHVVMELGSTEAILTAVEAGLGISVVSRWAADKALALGQVREIKVEGLDFKRDLFIIIHRQTLPNRALEEFQTFLANFRIPILSQVSDLA
jgi:DNA-binding transcriptional LysR family regulator